MPVIPPQLLTKGVFVDGVRTGNVAAFSISGDLTEQIVVAAEYREGEPETIESDIIRAVQRDVGLTVSEVVLIEAGSLPKTTSGKLQRSATRDQYLDGTLGRLRFTPSASCAQWSTSSTPSSSPRPPLASAIMVRLQLDL